MAVVNTPRAFKKILFQLNGVFLWLNLVRLYSFYKILYPKRRIDSCSMMGTIVSPPKILLN